jgi:ribosomal protein S18 acetylase RimI-like enzyme
MTAAPPRNRLVELDRHTLVERLDEALDVYVSAMGYPPSTARSRRSLWLDHARRSGWRAVGWIGAGGDLLGVAYGYRGGAGQWWFEEVSRGLRLSAPDRLGWLVDYFELTELHVRPAAQGGGFGEGMLRALVVGAGTARVLLSTPEYLPRPPSRAWRLYRRLGFVDVLRDHLFAGDARPFAVLGRSLPLDDAATRPPPTTPLPPGTR